MKAITTCAARSIASCTAASSRMQAFFKECDVHDLLDAVTVIYDYLHRNDDYLSKKSADDYNPYEAWRNEVDRIFREEHLAYRLDDDAVVRPGIDTTAARRRLLSRFPRWLREAQPCRDRSRSETRAIYEFEALTDHSFRSAVWPAAIRSSLSRPAPGLKLPLINGYAEETPALRGRQLWFAGFPAHQCHDWRDRATPLTTAEIARKLVAAPRSRDAADTSICCRRLGRVLVAINPA